MLSETPFKLRSLSLTGSLWMGVALLSSCATVQKNQEEREKIALQEQEVKAQKIHDLRTVLGMSFYEALLMSKEGVQIAPFFSMAAQSITDKVYDEAGNLRGATGRDRVFLQVDYLEPLSAIANVAIIGDFGVELRGQPCVKRGGTIISSTSEETVFRITGQNLQVEGPHEIHQESEIPDDYSNLLLSDWLNQDNPLLPPVQSGQTGAEARLIENPSSDPPQETGTQTDPSAIPEAQGVERTQKAKSKSKAATKDEASKTESSAAGSTPKIESSDPPKEEVSEKPKKSWNFFKKKEPQDAQNPSPDPA